MQETHFAAPGAGVFSRRLLHGSRRGTNCRSSRPRGAPRKHSGQGAALPHRQRGLTPNPLSILHPPRRLTFRLDRTGTKKRRSPGQAAPDMRSLLPFCIRGVFLPKSVPADNPEYFGVLIRVASQSVKRLVRSFAPPHQQKRAAHSQNRWGERPREPDGYSDKRHVRSRAPPPKHHSALGNTPSRNVRTPPGAPVS
jgi:hypothetical protein